MLKKFDIAERDRAQVSSAERTRVNFFFTVPDHTLTGQFSLEREPIVAQYLASPACSCSEKQKQNGEAASLKASETRASKRGASRTKASDIAVDERDPVPAVSQPEPATGSQAAGMEDSGPDVADERCWYCKCLVYYDIRVLGVPVCYDYPLAKKTMGFKDDIYALDGLGNIKVVPGGRVA